MTKSFIVKRDVEPSARSMKEGTKILQSIIPDVLKAVRDSGFFLYEDRRAARLPIRTKRITKEDVLNEMNNND